MTQGEYLTAHAVRALGAGYTSDAVLSVFRKNGLPGREARGHGSMRGNNRYSALVPEFPVSYRRIIEGDTVRVGRHDWKAIIGHGHAPEHLSLYCEELNVVIAGDMLLSTISTNVSVWSIDPEGDPLRLFLESIARYRELPPDVLVLPSHGRPFPRRPPPGRAARGAPRGALRRAEESLRRARRARASSRAALPPSARHAPDLLRHGRGHRPPALPATTPGRRAAASGRMASCATLADDPESRQSSTRICGSVAERSSRILGDFANKQAEASRRRCATRWASPRLHGPLRADGRQPGARSRTRR